MNTEVFGRVRLCGVSREYRDGEYFLEGEVFHVGRAPGSDLVLADRTVSGRHARIVHRVDGYWVEDLKSTNGTFVNGNRVDRQRLRTGDRLAFDKLEFIFKDPGDVPRTAMAESTDGISPVDNTSPRPEVIPAENKRVRLNTREFTPRELPEVQGKNHPLVGRLIGLLLAFLVAYTGMLAAFLANGGGVESAVRWLRGTVRIFPRLYLHPVWMGVDPSLAMILGLCGLVLAPMLGGFTAWRLGRGSRTFSALWVGILYSLVAAVISLVEAGFRFSDWALGFPSVIPLSMPSLAVAGVGLLYMAVVCFFLALLGSAFSR